MTAQSPITEFELDPNRLAVLAECTGTTVECTGSAAEWPNNILSRRTVVYGSGKIARQGEEVCHSVDSDELELCRQLSSEVALLVRGQGLDMGSEASFEFRAFFIAGNSTQVAPGKIDNALIQERFADTIFPPATITVEPLAEQGVWWREVRFWVNEDGDEEDRENEDNDVRDYLYWWRRMIEWFTARREFLDTAFVRIGDCTALSKLPKETWPKGTETIGSVLPRLSLGLTCNGSLVGLFGYVVKTQELASLQNANVNPV